MREKRKERGLTSRWKEERPPSHVKVATLAPFLLILEAHLSVERKKERVEGKAS